MIILERYGIECWYRTFFCKRTTLIHFFLEQTLVLLDCVVIEDVFAKS